MRAEEYLRKIHDLTHKGVSEIFRHALEEDRPPVLDSTRDVLTWIPLLNDGEPQIRRIYKRYWDKKHPLVPVFDEALHRARQAVQDLILEDAPVSGHIESVKELVYAFDGLGRGLGPLPPVLGHAYSVAPMASMRNGPEAPRVNGLYNWHFSSVLRGQRTLFRKSADIAHDLDPVTHARDFETMRRFADLYLELFARDFYVDFDPELKDVAIPAHELLAINLLRWHPDVGGIFKDPVRASMSISMSVTRRQGYQDKIDDIIANPEQFGELRKSYTQDREKAYICLGEADLVERGYLQFGLYEFLDAAHRRADLKTQNPPRSLNPR